MAKKPAKQKKRTATTPGPKPELFKLDGNWEDNVKKSFQKKKPPG